MRDFGFDPSRSSLRKAMGVVYGLLCDRASSEFGLLLEPAPSVPRLREFVNPDTPIDKQTEEAFKAHQEAMRVYQLKLTQLNAITSIEQLDELLAGGPNGVD